MKKKYDVHGTVPVVVHITVEAENVEQAMEIATQKFKGVHDYMGNGGCDKLMLAIITQDSERLSNLFFTTIYF